MITIRYIHSHDCQWKDQIVEVRPDSDGGTGIYRVVHPRCLETNAELQLVGTEVLS